MTKALNIESIEKATGKSWADWLAFLNEVGAKDLNHQQIVHEVYEQLVKSGTFDDAEANNRGRQNSSGWWAQNVTVAYEQYVGRRAPGQRADGTFEVAIAKTFDGNMDDAIAWWNSKVKGLTKFNNVAFKDAPTTSQTDKRRHWAVNLADGTRITADASPKTGDKSLLAITAMKLDSSEALESWREYFKQFLANF